MMAPQWLEETNQDTKPAAKLTCALEYNAWEVSIETKSVSA
jgi:hypothetical protein